MMKKLVALLTALMVLTGCVCALAEEGENVVISLGSTGYTIAIPASFTARELAEGDLEDDQIAYYASDESLLDFDLYEFATEGKTLEDYMKEEAALFFTEEVELLEVNGIQLAFYAAEENYEETEFTTWNYLMQDGETFVEIVFWMDGEDAETLAQEILNSLAFAE